ncbi:MAG: hypothetical protein J6P73_01360 [Bacteroidales bacterium]|nr:hypothetical protein [Bacteroidales bacterium]
MKTKKFIFCFVAIATMLLAGCGKDPKNELVNTTWKLDSPNDVAYWGNDVVYTIVFGQNDDVTFTRVINSALGVTTAIMEGTYTFANGSGIASVHNQGETTDYRITFQVSGDTLIWHYSLRDLTLTKVN